MCVVCASRRIAACLSNDGYRTRLRLAPSRRRFKWNQPLPRQALSAALDASHLGDATRPPPALLPSTEPSHSLPRARSPPQPSALAWHARSDDGFWSSSNRLRPACGVHPPPPPSHRFGSSSGRTTRQQSCNVYLMTVCYERGESGNGTRLLLPLQPEGQIRGDGAGRGSRWAAYCGCEDGPSLSKTA